MYIDTQTNAYPVTEAEIRAAHPDTLFPTPFVPPARYKLVFPTPQPTHDSLTHGVREATPLLMDKGHYEQQWEVFALPAEVVAENQARKLEQENEQIKAAIAKIEAGQARAVREAALGATTYLQQIEAQIQALRSQLK